MINENIRNILAISEVETLFKLIGDENIYLVGGCIRNALSNKAVKILILQQFLIQIRLLIY